MRNDNAPNANTNQGRRGRSNLKSKEKVNSTDVVVPILQFGSGNNSNVFKAKLAIVALEKFGDLARLIETDEYWEPPNTVDISQYDSDEDPHGFIKLQVNELLKERVRVLEKMKTNKANLYGFILSKLSNESMNEVERHKSFNEFNSSKDPLELWLSVKHIHIVDTNSCRSLERKLLVTSIIGSRRASTSRWKSKRRVSIQHMKRALSWMMRM